MLLSQKYQAKQEEPQSSSTALQNDFSAAKQRETDAEMQVSLDRQYSALTELTAETRNALIEKIVTHEAFRQTDGTRKHFSEAAEMKAGSFTVGIRCCRF